MISKLVVWGQDREEATRIALLALHDYIIHGIQTNISYLLELLQSPMFSQNKISTKFCDDHTGEIIESIHGKRSEIPYHIPVAGFLLSTLHPYPCDRNPNEKGETIWSQIGYWRNMMSFEVMFGERPVLVRLLEHSRCASHLLIDEIHCHAVVTSMVDNRIDYRIGSDLHHGYFSGDLNGRHYFSCQGHLFAMRRADFLPEAVPLSYRDAQGDGQDHVSAPMPGKVIKIQVSENQEVRKGDVLLILEAMKMENSVAAQRDARIKKINVTLNQAVEVSTPLIEFEKQE
jgi:3-methylcrotonyl-CoA carboxylase alpha subunit